MNTEIHLELHNFANILQPKHEFNAKVRISIRICFKSMQQVSECKMLPKTTPIVSDAIIMATTVFSCKEYEI